MTAATPSSIVRALRAHERYPTPSDDADADCRVLRARLPYIDTLATPESWLRAVLHRSVYADCTDGRLEALADLTAIVANDRGWRALRLWLRATCDQRFAATDRDARVRLGALRLLRAQLDRERRMKAAAARRITRHLAR